MDENTNQISWGDTSGSYTRLTNNNVYGTMCGICGYPAASCSCWQTKRSQQSQPVYNPPTYYPPQNISQEVLGLLQALMERLDNIEALVQNLVLESIKKDPYGLGEASIDS